MGWQRTLAALPRHTFPLNWHALLPHTTTTPPHALSFTPDDTHFSIASDALAAGMHVLLTKPLTLTLAQHRELEAAGRAKGLLCCGEFHKRWDPLYADARERLRKMGDLSFFTAYMSQPKMQLDTFAAWAGKSSDISYYLNSHHIDFLCWCLEGKSRPETVTAASSIGVAEKQLTRPGVEDTITLLCNVRQAFLCVCVCAVLLAKLTALQSILAATSHSRI